MARAQVSDFLHTMRFLVEVFPAGTGTFTLNSNLGSGTDGPAAGFTQVTTPAVNVQTVEYREGHYIYTRKYPGIPTQEDLTLQRGVTRGDSSFWNWVQISIEGAGEYRVDLAIKHFHRDNTLTRPTAQTQNQTKLTLTSPARTYLVHEAFPTRHKVASDFDSSSSEISIMELGVAYEYFEIQEGRP